MWEKKIVNQNVIYSKNLSFTEITVQITRLGTDYSIMVWGGDKPHIGCTVLVVPRLSLTGDGSRSSTASVINVTGHKDEEICRYLAEQTTRSTGSVTVCTGGIHMEDATKEQIREVMSYLEDLCRHWQQNFGSIWD